MAIQLQPGQPQQQNPGPFLPLGQGASGGSSQPPLQANLGKADPEAILSPQKDKNPLDYWSRTSQNPYGVGVGASLTPEAAAWGSYMTNFGRPPTQQELAQALPNFQTAGVSGGNAYVAGLYNDSQNTPDKLYAKQQAEYAKNAPQHYDAVNGLFQSQLGRDATQEEKDHFGSLLASGTTDSYQLQNFLQQQPEYQNKQNDQFRQGLSGTMAANDKRQFSEQILPSIQEAYAKQGRSFDSSAFANSATQSAQAQNNDRENFLANLSAQQYGGVQDRAYQDYANQVANQQNLTNSGIQAQYAGLQKAQDRTNSIIDFGLQRDAYNQYLAKYGKRNNGVGGLVGGGLGAAVGGYFGGTAGAKLGFDVGSAGGTAIQNSGGSY